MGLTLIEAAKYETRLEHLAVIKTFSEGELLARLPFMNIAGGGIFYSVEKELPSVGFRAVNEGYRQSYGVVDPQSEAVHLFGGDVDVDRSIVDLQGPEARASQVEMKVRSMRLTLEAALINGDATANQARGFDGLARRLRPGEEMAINNGGTALDFDKLDELIDSVNSYGGMKYLVMSKAMRRQLNALTQDPGGFRAAAQGLATALSLAAQCSASTPLAPANFIVAGHPSARQQRAASLARSLTRREDRPSDAVGVRRTGGEPLPSLRQAAGWSCPEAHD